MSASPTTKKPPPVASVKDFPFTLKVLPILPWSSKLKSLLNLTRNILLAVPEVVVPIAAKPFTEVLITSEAVSLSKDPNTSSSPLGRPSTPAGNENMLAPAFCTSLGVGLSVDPIKANPNDVSNTATPSSIPVKPQTFVQIISSIKLLSSLIENKSVRSVVGSKSLFPVHTSVVDPATINPVVVAEILLTISFSKGFPKMTESTNTPPSAILNKTISMLPKSLIEFAATM